MTADEICLVDIERRQNLTNSNLLDETAGPNGDERISKINSIYTTRGEIKCEIRKSVVDVDLEKSRPSQFVFA